MVDILFDDVCYSYDGETDVLRHVSLSIERGEYIAILGHNGSGKSTLARCINALIVPDSGTVRIAGLDSSDPDEQLEIRRHAGMVFQNPDNQMVTSIVADDVAFGPENLGIPQPEIVERVESALAAVAMTDFAQADPSELSGGQKQRVSVAGMLAMHPDILVLDEPGAMLDPRGRRGVRRVMRDLNDTGITIVHITHFMDDALEADRVLVMDAGQLVLSGTPDEVFAHAEQLRQLGLEQPFAMQLAERLRARGIDVPDSPHIEIVEEALCRLRSSM
ncbi:MAG: energy-coupling factor transporter ATPase [Coriobacteriia bacterium]|nr:energy-coupling factor transporter ATPase [Coriobacteriia bacterium]MBS5477531.1 energy-coupling factor transporter ATPase [Coriobacteriia bacterium]